MGNHLDKTCHSNFDPTKTSHRKFTRTKNCWQCNARSGNVGHPTIFSYCSMLSMTLSAQTDGTRSPAMWGVTTTFGWVQKGCCCGRGSVANTSSTARDLRITAYDKCGCNDPIVSKKQSREHGVLSNQPGMSAHLILYRCPDSSAESRSASTIWPPLPRLITQDPLGIAAKNFADSNPRVSQVSGRTLTIYLRRREIYGVRTTTQRWQRLLNGHSRNWFPW